jgi:hypothetical protein
MDPKVAKEIAERIGKASTLCNTSLRTVMTHEGLGHVQVYGRLVGNFMGYSYTNLLAPIWKAFPQLEPPEMRAPHVEQPPTLTPESRQALTDFLREARAALDFARTAIAPGDAEKFFGFGGLSEVDEAVSAIETYLAHPRVRDTEGKS